MKNIHLLINASLFAFLNLLILFFFLNGTVLADDHDKVETSTDCVGSTDPECKNSKKYTIHLFKLGREAYDLARQNKNYTEVYKIAKELIDRNDRNGKRLFKMVIIQLAKGDHKNFDEARQMINNAIDSGVDYAPLWLEKFDRMIEEKKYEVN